MKYPIEEVIPALRTALLQNTTVLLQAPPGAGKSTILPLQLMQEPWLHSKKILMLEPRRLAAKSVAERMADLQHTPLGKEIGYRVRFDSKVSSSTRLEVVTEGILTRKLQHDNALEDVGLIIFDEFHERSLQADLALALCKQTQSFLRDDLRILIMSATLDSGALLKALGNIPVITSEGKQYPVTIHYHKDRIEGNVMPVVLQTIRRALQQHEGDILVFLPGAGEIQTLAKSLEEEFASIKVYPLYGDLSFQKQQMAILPDPSGYRKVVLATTIAETSLTIEGIKIVIDSGLARTPKFDPRSGLTRLETTRITKDAAAQRTGRAGRLGPGVSYRVWNEGIQSTLLESRKPEILEADLASLVLELFQWGVSKPESMTWITQPPLGALAQAKDLLESLGAIEGDRITEKGRAMLHLPTHPRIAHLLLEASPALKSVATDVAALLEERDPLGKEVGADLTLRIDELRKWRMGHRTAANLQALNRIEKIASQWRKHFAIEVANDRVEPTVVGDLLRAAYPERLARQITSNGARYKLANGRTAVLQPYDSLTSNTWISIAHVDAGQGEGKIFLAAPIDKGSLQASAYEREVVYWDEERSMIAAALERKVGTLVLSSKPIHRVDEEQKLKVWCEVIRDKGISLLGWTDVQRQWQARVMSLKSWRIGEAWPDVSDEALLQTVDVWLTPFLTGISRLSELQRLDWSGILFTLPPWELASRMDVLAPTRIQVPSGSNIQVHYFTDGRPPIMEVRLQEMFGLVETPSINEGRTSILLHLLSPGYKPVQVTQDLKSFWHTTYHEVRKELRMRYPKHHWPEDPWTAEAVRGVKKKTS